MLTELREMCQMKHDIKQRVVCAASCFRKKTDLYEMSWYIL